MAIRSNEQNFVWDLVNNCLVFFSYKRHGYDECMCVCVCGGFNLFLLNEFFGSLAARTLIIIVRSSHLSILQLYFIRAALTIATTQYAGSITALFMCLLLVKNFVQTTSCHGNLDLDLPSNNYNCFNKAVIAFVFILRSPTVYLALSIHIQDIIQLTDDLKFVYLHWYENVQ